MTLPDIGWVDNPDAAERSGDVRQNHVHAWAPGPVTAGITTRPEGGDETHWRAHFVCLVCPCGDVMEVRL